MQAPGRRGMGEDFPAAEPAFRGPIPPLLRGGRRGYLTGIHILTLSSELHVHSIRRQKPGAADALPLLIHDHVQPAGVLIPLQAAPRHLPPPRAVGAS